MATKSHRELARRQHRTLGHYLAMEAWARGADCIVVNRAELEPFLGLERFRGERVRWMQRDLRSWFPHQNVVYYARPGRPLGAVYLSRVELDDAWPNRTMTDEKRVAALNDAGIRTTLLGGLPSEDEILGKLVGMASGLVEPTRGAIS